MSAGRQAGLQHNTASKIAGGRQASQHEGADERPCNRWCKGYTHRPVDSLGVRPAQSCRQRVNEGEHGHENSEGQRAERSRPQEGNRQELDIASAHQFLRIEIQHDEEHQDSESNIPMQLSQSAGQSGVDQKQTSQKQYEFILNRELLEISERDVKQRRGCQDENDLRIGG